QNGRAKIAPTAESHAWNPKNRPGILFFARARHAPVPAPGARTRRTKQGNNGDFDVKARPYSENRFDAPSGRRAVTVMPAFGGERPGMEGGDADGWGAVKAFFTTRPGGFSAGPYASLNLGFHTGDDAGAVARNWDTLLRAQGLVRPPDGHIPAGGPEAPRPVMPRLCHGAALLDADDPRAVAAHAGADAVFTRVRGRVLAVTTADCLAALVVDPAAGC